MRTPLLAASLLAVALALAPVLAAPINGDSEIQLSGGAFHSQGSNSGAFTEDIGYGYFLTPGLEA